MEIKKCVLCKRWDDASTMYYNKHTRNYWHRECDATKCRNHKKIAKQASYPSNTKDTRVFKCMFCGGYDSDPFHSRRHNKCNKVKDRNAYKMKKQLNDTDVCAFTGLPFGPGEKRANGDHDHETLMYRGHIWSAANRLEGAAKFIMDEAGWTVDDLCAALKSYLAKPGIDIGLEPYPQLGYATPEEALANLSTSV